MLDKDIRTQEECLALIDETLEYYKKNPRGIADGDSGRCMYFDESNGNMCAVGRCLSEPKEYIEVYKLASQIINRDGDEVFKKEYRNYPTSLWSELQRLHDEGGNWDGMELTELGEEAYRNLKNEIWSSI